MVMKFLRRPRNPWLGSLSSYSGEEREDSLPRSTASFTCSQCSYARKTGITERERHVLNPPPQSSSGKKAGPFAPAWPTSALRSASSIFCLSVFCVLRLFPKESSLVHHIQREALLSLEAVQPHFLRISLLGSKFPFIKVKPHFYLIFSCFPQQSWMQSWACFSHSFIFLSFHN